MIDAPADTPETAGSQEHKPDETAAEAAPDHNDDPISAAQALKMLSAARKTKAAAAAAMTKAQTKLAAAEHDSELAIQALRAAGIPAETLKDLGLTNSQ